MIALLIGYELALRLFNPVSIGFDWAIAIAAVGLGVNLGSAWLLRERHGDHLHHHHDQQGTSSLITTTICVQPICTFSPTRSRLYWRSSPFVSGRLYGWVWMDPMIGIVGALVIAPWSLGLLAHREPCCSIPSRTHACGRKSRNAWKSAPTGWLTCISGCSVRDMSAS